MIRKAMCAVFLIALGAGLAYYALSHHLIKTDKGYLSVAKVRMTAKKTYVDIRAWKRTDFEENPAVTAALLEHGHEDLVPLSSSERIKRWLEEKTREALE